MLEVFYDTAVNHPFRYYDSLAYFLLIVLRNTFSGMPEDMLKKLSILAVASLYIVPYPNDAQMDSMLIKEILSRIIEVFGENDIRVTYITALCFAKYGYELYGELVPFIESTYL